MARRYWSLNRGQNEFDVVEGAASAGEQIELNIDLTASLDREDVLLALDKFRNSIIKDQWPPA